MRLDHVAYRVADRHKTVKFFHEAFGYKTQTEFEINFDDGSTAKCFALEPPEKIPTESPLPWTFAWPIEWRKIEVNGKETDFITRSAQYHLAPEIFISDGSPDSVVGKWVQERAGIGGIHHLAYQVGSVEKVMEQWRKKGYAEFTTENPLTCPGLTQCFTKPSELTGVIYEFIERDSGSQGFCKDNVKDLMESTAGL